MGAVLPHGLNQSSMIVFCRGRLVCPETTWAFFYGSNGNASITLIAILLLSAAMVNRAQLFRTLGLPCTRWKPDTVLGAWIHAATDGNRQGPSLILPHVAIDDVAPEAMMFRLTFRGATDKAFVASGQFGLVSERLFKTRDRPISTPCRRGLAICFVAAGVVCIPPRCFNRSRTRSLRAIVVPRCAGSVIHAMHPTKQDMRQLWRHCVRKFILIPSWGPIDDCGWRFTVSVISLTHFGFAGASSPRIAVIRKALGVARSCTRFSWMAWLDSLWLAMTSALQLGALMFL